MLSTLKTIFIIICFGVDNSYLLVFASTLLLTLKPIIMATSAKKPAKGGASSSKDAKKSGKK